MDKAAKNLQVQNHTERLVSETFDSADISVKNFFLEIKRFPESSKINCTHRELQFQKERCRKTKHTSCVTDFILNGVSNAQTFCAFEILIKTFKTTKYVMIFV